MKTRAKAIIANLEVKTVETKLMLKILFNSNHYIMATNKMRKNGNRCVTLGQEMELSVTVKGSFAACAHNQDDKGMPSLFVTMTT